MIKKVNIKASVPIKDFRPPIYGTCNGIEMTTGEILKCLCKRAIVDEVLADGSTIRLDLKNYYTDNTPKTIEVPAADKVQVVETSVPVDVHDETPVTELEPVVECETATTDVTDAADAVEGVIEVETTPVEDATADMTDAVEELVTEDEAAAEAVVTEVEEAAEEVVAEAEDVVEEVVEEAEPKVDTTANKAATYNNNNGGKKKKKH